MEEGRGGKGVLSVSDGITRALLSGAPWEYLLPAQHCLDFPHVPRPSLTRFRTRKLGTSKLGVPHKRACIVRFVTRRRIQLDVSVILLSSCWRGRHGDCAEPF